MKKLNDNVTINQVSLVDWQYDDDDFTKPAIYTVNLTFYGYEYEMNFTTADLRNAEKWGLSNSGCYGYSPLFDSADTYFEENEKEADALMELMEEEWEDYWREDSPYNYMGVKDEL